MKLNPNLVDIYKKDIIKPSIIEQEYLKWYDSLQTRYPLSYYVTGQDMKYLRKLAISPSMNCNVKEKYYLMGELMRDRGFELIGGGTNRRAYKCTFENIIFKIATDQVGFTSNLRELPNQNVLKPFCTKIFGVDREGIISQSEVFIPFKTVEEFQKYSPDIYDILYFKIRNNSIGMEDIGTRSFKNWGYRNGFGPGLLDFPTMYVLDPRKRLCHNIINGQICGGTLDYDEGFNSIVCSECGRTHFAKTLAKQDGEDIDQLLQAVGYQHRKMKKESIGMKFSIVDLATGEEDVRETNNKSSFVKPNGRRVKPIINLNERQPERKRELKFSLVDIKPEETETTADDNNSSEDNSSEHVIIESNNEFAVDVTKPISDILSAFDEAVINTGLNYDIEDCDRESYTESIIELIKKNTQTTSSFMSYDKAISLYREVSVATLDLDQCINDGIIINNDNTMVARLLKEIYPETPNPEAFYSLINTVPNTASFFECVVSFFNVIINKFSFDIDEIPGGTDTHSMYVSVYKIVRDVLEHVFNDYFVNVTFNQFISYNRNNAFVMLRNKLDEMAKTFDMSEHKNDVVAVTIFRNNDYASIVIDEISSSEDETEDEETADDKEVTEEESSDEEDEATEEEVTVPETKNDVIQEPPRDKMTRKQKRRFDKNKKKKH